MKIRTGFVSNSSSSSFMIMGVVFDPNMFSSEVQDIYAMDSLLRDAGVRCPYDWVHVGLDDYPDTDFIGLSMSYIGEDETKAQFRKRIFDTLQKIGYTGSLENLTIYQDQGRV